MLPEQVFRALALPQDETMGMEGVMEVRHSHERTLEGWLVMLKDVGKWRRCIDDNVCLHCDLGMDFGGLSQIEPQRALSSFAIHDLHSLSVN
jgi:hypothetical protein